MNKEPRYCQFCGNNLGVVMYTNSYVKNLEKENKHLTDIVNNKTFAKYLTLKDAENLLTAYVNYYGKEKVVALLSTLQEHPYGK